MTDLKEDMLVTNTVRSGYLPVISSIHPQEATVSHGSWRLTDSSGTCASERAAEWVLVIRCNYNRTQLKYCDTCEGPRLETKSSQLLTRRHLKYTVISQFHQREEIINASLSVEKYHRVDSQKDHRGHRR